LTSGKNYDVFAYWSGSAVTLELSAAWTSDTARADALARQDGVWVKSGTTTRRYVGTIRTISTTQTTDAKLQRFVWNYYNRLPMELKVIDTTNSWSYTSTTYRAANNNADNSFEYVTGEAHYIEVYSVSAADASAINFFGTGIGIDSTSVNSALIFTGVTRPSGSSISCAYAQYKGRQALGYHKITWLESGNTGTTFYGDGNVTTFQTGMVGVVLG
jgi:hypothetical protein